MKRTKGRKTRNARRKTKANRKKKMSGGCGCGRSMIGGGSAGLAELPARYYYDLKDESHNPNPAYAMKGGSKKRKIRGGMPSFLLGPAANPVTGYGEVSGLLSGISPSAGDVTVQPIINGASEFYA